MEYYPALLDLRGKLCCVIGGGAVACRKVRSLLDAGASVTVIAPRLSKPLGSLARSGAVAFRRGAYRSRYIRRAFLVIAATSDAVVNRSVSKDARRFRILSNIVDQPALSSFIVPAVLSRNGLIIAVSTSGKAPALSKRIKEDLRSSVLAKYSAALRNCARERARLTKDRIGFNARKKILGRMAREELGRR